MLGLLWLHQPPPSLLRHIYSCASVLCSPLCLLLQVLSAAGASFRALCQGRSMGRVPSRS
jgi:hypothetical protein